MEHTGSRTSSSWYGLTNHAFGSTVAIDGTTIVVGALYSSYGRGYLYAFTRSGSTWTGKYITNQKNGFATSLALDGDILAVGRPHYGGSGWRNGYVYIYTRSSGSWSQRAALSPNDYTNGQDDFGASVALSGTTLAIGAPKSNPYKVGQSGSRATDAGVVYIYTGSGNSWTKQATLTASTKARGDLFGSTLALSGGTLFAGVPGADSSAGAVYTFTGSGGTWTQQQKLTASDGIGGDSFGSALSASGNKLVVGAYTRDSSTGSAYLFTDDGTAWTQKHAFTASDKATGDAFAFSVGTDAYTSTTIIGAYKEDPGEVPTPLPARHTFSLFLLTGCVITPRRTNVFLAPRMITRWMISPPIIAGGVMATEAGRIQALVR